MDAMKELSPLKQFWITLFMMISRVTYFNSDKIITLYRGNQNLQIKHGADIKKCSVIPNGIDIQRFKYKRISASAGPEYMVGFVGRIVPIKDVKSLLHAARFVVDRLAGAKFYLKGPFDEDKPYYEECKVLVSLLNLDQNVFFTGPSDVTEFYRELDVLVLSSVSEAQPLSLLEANLCAVPVVSTDVGAVRELLYGIDDEDAKLGPSGIVVPVKSPQALGEEIVKLLSNRDLNNKMGAAGVKRVLSYYKKEDLMTKYHDIYKGYIK
ncbi:MAG TPA: GT4 family glycosyltransferase PelF, partial [Candidatus Wallbacteria bacterium]|nr:GT4 family glycosyltransferase PelF [Candidatus Wallbacteria bacterium]